ncbi:MAG: thymidine phosphorylase, partial [Acidobacteriota bacterium]
RRFVAGAAAGELGDEQLAALLMAICIRGASAAETEELVLAMRDSGACWRLAETFPDAVDKHSTGGVGDTVSLVFAPLVAACGPRVAMMAGAGLGHTQGTLDKLAAIPGFATAKTREAALGLLAGCRVCFAAQSNEIAPADRKLYALRDITGTVPSVPLIVASIMSKKLAVGAGQLVLDVKSGSGALFKTFAEAERLASGLLGAAAAGGARAVALISDMSEPLGDYLGCAGEVRAALEVLDGGGDARLRELTVELAAEALMMAGRSRTAALAELMGALASGAAREHWDRIVVAHGGDPDPRRLAHPASRMVVTAPRAGFIGAVAGEELGWIAVALGAGRRHNGDAVDFAAGLRVHARCGARVERSEPLVTLDLGLRPVEGAALAARAAAAFSIVDEAPARIPLLLGRLAGPR